MIEKIYKIKKANKTISQGSSINLIIIHANGMAELLRSGVCKACYLFPRWTGLVLKWLPGTQGVTLCSQARKHPSRTERCIHERGVQREKQQGEKCIRHVGRPHGQLSSTGWGARSRVFSVCSGVRTLSFTTPHHLASDLKLLLFRDLSFRKTEFTVSLVPL